MFTSEDLSQLQSKGISRDKAELQIQNFKNGFPFADIIAPATTQNGILAFDEAEIAHYKHLYDENNKHDNVVKFVPASGAASRMFKALFEALNDDSEISLADKGGLAALSTFFNRLSDFAFFEDLKTVFEKNYGDFDDRAYKNILKALLLENGLNYGNLPKGLLRFHKYADGNRTATEEHLVEAAEYGASDGKASVHFTVSPEHLEAFQKHIGEIKGKYESKYKLTFDIQYSMQKPATDTLAVNTENEPFRNDDGSILFRPGGHGALIENLNDIQADIIFIKNIDNVVPDSLKPETVTYKKVIGGVLTELRDQIFKYINALNESPSEQLVSEILDFFSEKLFYKPQDSFNRLDLNKKADFLKTKLNRPVRVCGMVKNEGEPGGGPFFVRNSKGETGLQIVESSQIDLDSQAKKQIVDNATHFNPVDLVCAVKDYEGNKFDLTKFVDAETGFISEKSKDGKALKAQELPGLWNGAMADWNTVFVEVPIITFNPVKIVNDLLRDQHQA